ncbi:hypothetical protein RND71_026712 [Anisodus tanguticus]|uniref:Uncharacterized protein n=1 Tax=Anisodus tanguticus TaxID=243964 RepID=A0AAE1V323_9SOLA|nr:hypothetical protein RND71_026712 [Anisodus tanguticus]
MRLKKLWRVYTTLNISNTSNYYSLERFPGLRLTTSLVLSRCPGDNSTGPSTLLPGKSRNVLRWECLKLMIFFHQKATIGKLTGVHRKCITSKYGYAARCEPASFRLEKWF